MHVRYLPGGWAVALWQHDHGCHASDEKFSGLLAVLLTYSSSDYCGPFDHEERELPEIGRSRVLQEDPTNYRRVRMNDLSMGNFQSSRKTWQTHWLEKTQSERT
jgi:hypothetical protein